ncbi:MAG TPA: UDP-N-acetylmuramoylalanyl-D-glutamyl-2, 6-diaminopimelate--D-alanyl-D-alanine ligase, partial [Lachnospiraceae bacterium]|nr:UDP-N-acetylmuramoylalanyl-D-glutamyl-2, 6-diaminopimelate--D-alanyl-D-alanine ligase [Lachnospiraceae bacterium]
EFGEMTRLSQIARPDICVITNIGQCHLETLGDRNGVLRAKTEIFSYMQENGTVYLNGDDDKLKQIKEVNGKKPVYYGLDKTCDVFADNIINDGLNGVYFDAVTSGSRIPVHVAVPGIHMVSDALASVAIATGLGMKAEEIATGISKFTPVGGHSNIIKTDKFIIMDDCYNANPVSMKAAIDVLASARGRKVAIIGDMFELGTNEKMLHYDIGAYAVKKDIDCIVCAGTLAKQYVAGALAIDGNHNVLYYENTEKALDMIKSIVKKGDSILIKASHAMEFEKIVAVLTPA